MKRTTYAISLLLLLGAGCAHATSYFTVGLHAHGTNQVVTVQSRPVTLARLKEVSAKLGALSSEQIVLVQVGEKVPATQLLCVLGILKDSGLANVAILPLGGQSTPVIRARLLPETNQFFRFEEPEELDGQLEEVDVSIEEQPGVEQTPAGDVLKAAPEE